MLERTRLFRSNRSPGLRTWHPTIRAGDSGLRTQDSSQVVMDTEAAPWVGPLHVLEDVTDDPAGAALDAALVGEEDATVVLGHVAIRWTAVDALLPLALQADLRIDDPDVGPVAIDVVAVERQL